MDVTTQEVHLGAVTLHAVSTGTGPLAVLLHGITANAYVFLPLMEHLAGKFRLVSIDMRGHGRSSKPASGYAAKDYADDIEALVRHLDSGPALLIGHALGARDAFVAGARNNGLVAAGVALDFTPPEVFEALGRRIGCGNRLFADTGAIERALSERYPLTPVRSHRPLARPDDMVQIANGMRESFEADFAALGVPTLLIHGGESRFISPEVWARRALRPDMRTVELPSADHYAVEQLPGPIAQEVVNFWQRDVQQARWPQDAAAPRGRS